MDALDSSIILNLSNILANKLIDTQAIQKALKLICDEFQFDIGAIYEIDQYNVFNLKEHYTQQDLEVSPSFVLENISIDYQEHLAKENLICIKQSSASNGFDIDLLDLFRVNATTLTAIIDEDNRISAFIVFSTLNCENNLSNFDLELLKILLSMLDKYIGIRVYQNKLSFARVSLESILDNTGIDIYVNDFYTHDILYVNKSMAAPYGGIDKFVNGKCWQILFIGQNGPCEFCPQQYLLDESGNPTKVYTWDYQRPFDGSWFRVFSAAFRWTDGRMAHVVSSADITDNKRNEELVQYLANYDSLTNLPNRRMLVADCERRINNAKSGEKAYILFFDIDGFKKINDEFGHDAGDEFLIKLGEFFSAIPMLKNSIYRNGGDEFVAVLDGIATKDNIRSLANFIHERFNKPWYLSKGNAYCNVSIGVACYPEDGMTANELLQRADQAMYTVKKTGGAHISFARELDNS